MLQGPGGSPFETCQDHFRASRSKIWRSSAARGP